MNYKKEHEDIARKIARQILGTATTQDLKDIEAWKMNNEQHERLHEELTQEENLRQYEKEMEAFPVEEGWKQIESRIESSSSPSRRIYKWTPMLRYAAVFLLCVMCAGFAAYYYLSITNQEKQSIAYNIPPGTHSAQLTLDNGQTIYLSVDKSILFNELNGIKIHQSPHGLSYIPTARLKDTLIYNRISTLTGMEYQLVLSDSTQIFMNAESALKYPVMFQGEERIVEMEGEAYFRVAKNEKCPFIVKIKGLKLKVLGTSFNVRAYKDEDFAQITLESGILEVNGQKIYPGDQLNYHYQDQLTSIQKVDTKQYVAWHEGQYLFRNERLEDIMRTLSRWYKFDYTFDDEQVKDVRIGAYFQRYNSMEPIINMLIKTNLVEVSYEKHTLHFASTKP